MISKSDVSIPNDGVTRQPSTRKSPHSNDSYSDICCKAIEEVLAELCHFVSLFGEVVYS